MNDTNYSLISSSNLEQCHSTLQKQLPTQCTASIEQCISESSDENAIHSPPAVTKNDSSQSCKYQIGLIYFNLLSLF